MLRGYNFILKQHLQKKHEDLWQQYLANLGKEIVAASSFSDANTSPPNSSKHVNTLKCSVEFKTSSGSNFSLLLPESRQTRELLSKESLVDSETLYGFKGRIKREYNMDPIGPYMAPFDQPENSLLTMQSPKSVMSFKEYT